MAYRVVTGTHLRSDNTPFAGYQVWFTLKPGGFSVTTNYPRNRVVAIVGADGRHHPRLNQLFDGVELWISEEATDRTEYRCQLPDGRIAEFELDAGVGPIDLTTLLTQDLSPSPIAPNDLVTEQLEALLAAHNADPYAHPNFQGEHIALLDGALLSWSLPSIPALPHLSNLFVNGTKMVLGRDYVVNSTIVLWQSPDLLIESTDTVEFYYR
jgi:hypothetical protein